MERIKRTNGHRERLQRALQHRLSQLDQRHTHYQFTGGLSMGPPKPPR